MPSKKIYKVIFYNQDEVFEIYVSHVFPSEMFGFLEVEELLFGERSQVLIDPGEERLKSEFSGVKRSYIPINSIIRIDEVEQEGTVKVTTIKSSVTSFPVPKGKNPLA